MVERRRSLAEGRYVLRSEPIGSGGMGVVWRAEDTILNRQVAVKQLRLPVGLRESERAALRERAMIEARAAGQLNHPSIVTVHDVLSEDGHPWIVMGLVEGSSLHDTVRENGPLSPQRTAEIGGDLLAALQVAHGAGIMHRDIKPQNVLLSRDGRAVLTDFGIATILDATQGLTATGSVMGTLGYVAPERLSGQGTGSASDLWSLGATLYFAVEGRPAYDAAEPAELIAAVLSRDPDPTERAGPLGSSLFGLMARHPDERPAAGRAAERLREIAAGNTSADQPTVRATVSSEVPSGALVPAEESPRSRRLISKWIAVAVVAVALLAGVLVAVYALGPDRTPNGETDRAGGGQPSKSPSATRSASPTATRFATPPKVCVYLMERTETMAAVIPKPKLWLAHEGSDSCVWRPSRDPDGDVNELTVEAATHGNFASCPEGGERLPGIGDEADILDEANLDADGWHEREVSVYFRVHDLSVCLRHWRSSLDSIPPDSREAMIKLARSIDQWMKKAPVTTHGPWDCCVIR